VFNSEHREAILDNSFSAAAEFHLAANAALAKALAREMLISMPRFGCLHRCPILDDEGAILNNSILFQMSFALLARSFLPRLWHKKCFINGQI
jgi:hypothetical protein